MPNAFTRAVSRVVAGPRATFRLVLSNAMFVVLVARELAVQTVDE